MLNFCLIPRESYSQKENFKPNLNGIYSLYKIFLPFTGGHTSIWKNWVSFYTLIFIFLETLTQDTDHRHWTQFTVTVFFYARS